MSTSSNIFRAARRGTSLIAFIGLVSASVLAVPARAGEQGPFAGLSGSWSGDGTIVMADGVNERIRCRATYAVPNGGTVLNQGLRCASDSYHFDVTSSVVADGDALTGTFSEAVHGVSGDITGHVKPGQIQTAVEAFGFSARLSVATRGTRQNVTIVPDGSDVRNVTIEMRRI